MHRTHRILVVDPCPDTCATTAWLLCWWGHEVVVAHDGPAALEAACAFRPDFVLTELALPGMNDYGLAERLRGPGRASDAVLVAVTGCGSGWHRRRSRAAGFRHHLVKPVEPPVLEALLDGGPPSAGGTADVAPRNRCGNALRQAPSLRTFCEN
jgi:two-component system CheB/CheR fusion protein